MEKLWNILKVLCEKYGAEMGFVEYDGDGMQTIETTVDLAGEEDNGYFAVMRFTFLSDGSVDYGYCEIKYNGEAYVEQVTAEEIDNYDLRNIDDYMDSLITKAEEWLMMGEDNEE